LGHENAGWVEEVGSDVKDYKKGDAVLVYGPWGCGHCKPCQQSRKIIVITSLKWLMVVG
jgi:propanol-preferring alcohol dehydrogenase